MLTERCRVNGAALHIIQDSYAGGHQYQLWTGHTTRQHLAADRVWSQAPVDASTRYLRALRGTAPMEAPDAYLYRPNGCRP